MTPTEALTLLNTLVSQMALSRAQHAQVQQAVVVLQATLAALAKTVPSATIAPSPDSPPAQE
ncbi:hypothetical protein LCGC14_0521030 [marine sediment metagenome]|uniref:Uncharacterized protein n=1 Tax=marine sediment metagenome TaxID=412755 RepID=A0A0F9RYI3_9ZZZZ